MNKLDRDLILCELEQAIYDLECAYFCRVHDGSWIRPKTLSKDQARDHLQQSLLILQRLKSLIEQSPTEIPT